MRSVGASCAIHASLYLHCDPTASHYLKLLCDSVFGPRNFRNEIIWKRSSAHSDTKQGGRRPGRIHDTLLFYTNSERWTWNPQHTDYEEEYVKRMYRHVEEETGRKYQLGDLSGPGGTAKGSPEYEVMGVTRAWRYSQEEMQKLIKAGRIVQTGPGARTQTQALPRRNARCASARHLDRHRPRLRSRRRTPGLPHTETRRAAHAHHRGKLQPGRHHS